MITEGHRPQTRQGGLAPPTLAPPRRGPSRAEIMAAAVERMRQAPKRERFAKAWKFDNYALALDRLADSGEGEWAAMRLAAAEFRRLAEALRE